jgi:hypothetical protein
MLGEIKTMNLTSTAFTHHGEIPLVKQLAVSQVLLNKVGPKNVYF